MFGFSDLQADIAAQLIRKGVQVTVFNQRSVEEIFSMLYQVAAMVGQARARAGAAGGHARAAAGHRAGGRALPRRPRCSSRSGTSRTSARSAGCRELLGIAGGDDIFPELAAQSLGKDRIIARRRRDRPAQPGHHHRLVVRQEVPAEKVAARPGWERVNAVSDGQLFEIKSADILQPGPAALTDGVEQLHRIVMNGAGPMAELRVARSELILGGQKSGKTARAEALAAAWLAQSPQHRAV